MKGKLRKMWKVNSISYCTHTGGKFYIYYLADSLEDLMAHLKEHEKVSIESVDSYNIVDINEDWEGGPVATRYYEPKNQNTDIKDYLTLKETDNA